MTMEFKVGDKVRICVSALEEAKRENPRANFSKVNKAVGFVGDIYDKHIKPVVDKILGFVGEIYDKHVKPVIDKITGFINNFIDGIPDFFSKTLPDFILDVMKKYNQLK